MTTLPTNLQLERPAERAAAGAANSCVASELGKCGVSQNSKVSPSDCVGLPEGATKVPSLILASLQRALSNLADLSRSLMELQKVLQASSEGFLTFSYISAEHLYRELLSVRHLLKSRLTPLLRDSSSDAHFKDCLPVLTGLRRQLS